MNDCPSQSLATVLGDTSNATSKWLSGDSFGPVAKSVQYLSAETCKIYQLPLTSSRDVKNNQHTFSSPVFDPISDLMAPYNVSLAMLKGARWLSFGRTRTLACSNNDEARSRLHQFSGGPRDELRTSMLASIRIIRVANII